MIIVEHEGSKYAFISGKGLWIDHTNTVVDSARQIVLSKMASESGHILPIPETKDISPIKESSYEDKVVDKPIRKGKKSTAVSLKGLINQKKEDQNV